MGWLWDILWSGALPHRDGSPVSTRLCSETLKKTVEVVSGDRPVRDLLLDDRLTNLVSGDEIELPEGAVLYCKLALVAEHTGIYLGNGKVAHLDGDGRICAVSPREFMERLDGDNPAVNVYYAAKGRRPLGSTVVGQRARQMIGNHRNYHLLLDNCHQFTSGCLSGNFENPCNFFWMVEAEIKSLHGVFNFDWRNWKF